MAELHLSKVQLCLRISFCQLLSIARLLFPYMGGFGHSGSFGGNWKTAGHVLSFLNVTFTAGDTATASVSMLVIVLLQVFLYW